MNRNALHEQIFSGLRPRADIPAAARTRFEVAQSSPQPARLPDLGVDDVPDRGRVEAIQDIFGVNAMTLARAAMIAALLFTTAPAMAQLAPRERELPRPTVCTEQYAPVCGRLNGLVKTYPNNCRARAAGAELIAQGPCVAQSPTGPK
jgi:hypothetical protein